MPHRHSIFCILPPYMLDQIVQNGSSAQSALAVQTRASSRLIRERRQGVALATTRSPFKSRAIVAAVKQRAVYTAKSGTRLPGTLVRSEGSASVPDAAVNEAYEGSGATFDLYHVIFGRNSIDDNGLKLISTVHYARGYDNAFWDGRQMVYGDGDEDLPVSQRLFNRFTISLDVIGHELTHGVTQYEANLTYSNQPGALNEAVSDIFGSLVKQYKQGQTAAQADWIIGEGLFTSNVKGVGIRSMKAPGTAYNDPVLGKDPQPAHMKDYVTTFQDNGGVHINSGIINHAFYVTAVEIGGFAWEKAGRIWYKALTEKMKSNSNFQNAADLTFEAAGELFGKNSLEQNAVKKGWSQVGITVTPIPEPTPVPIPEPIPVPIPEPTPVPIPEPTPVPIPEPTNIWYQVTATALNVREGPAASRKSLGFLSRNDGVMELETSADGTWRKIERVDGLTGWCSGRFLKSLGKTPAAITQKLFTGVVYHRKTRLTPKPMVSHALVIDLQSAAFEFLITPPIRDKEPFLCTLTTTGFLEKYQLRIAINGGGFDYLDPATYNSQEYCADGGEPIRLVGFASSRGKQYSTKAPGHPILYISQKNVITVDKPASTIFNAITGDRVLVTKGVKVPNLESTSMDPRTAIGVNQNGRWLVLVVVDGGEFSEGATFPELADLLLSHGVYTGISMDGGGSSTLAIKGIDSKPRAVSKLFDEGVPGQERKVANHVGIYLKK